MGGQLPISRAAKRWSDLGRAGRREFTITALIVIGFLAMTAWTVFTPEGQAFTAWFV